MDIIETLNPTMFTDYLKKYGNTICGRHPISVLLQVNIFTFIKQKFQILVYFLIYYAYMSVFNI